MRPARVRRHARAGPALRRQRRYRGAGHEGGVWRDECGRHGKRVRPA